MKKRVYLVMNFKTKSHYLIRALQNRGVQLRVNGIPHRLRSIVHYPHFGSFLWNLLKVIRSIYISLIVKQCETIIVLDDTASAVFIAVFVQMLHKSNHVILLNMIDNLSGSKFKAVLYRLAFKRLLCSVNNEELINLYHRVYNIPTEQFFIQPDTIDDFGMRILREDKDNTDEGYIFTGGNSYRDWELFLKVVKALPQYQFVGVAARPSFPKGNFPQNLTMYFDIPREKFLSLLRHCRIGYIPINVKTQGGQIVVYELSLYHKPVVTTDSYAIKSIINNGENGYLVEIGDVKSSVNAIESLMENNSIRADFGQRIFNKVSKLTTDYFCELLFKFMHSKNIDI